MLMLNLRTLLINSKHIVSVDNVTAEVTEWIETLNIETLRLLYDLSLPVFLTPMETSLHSIQF
jgi:hypothetical protein